MDFNFNLKLIDRYQCSQTTYITYQIERTTFYPLF